MTKKRLISLIVCLIIAIPGLCGLSLADYESGINTDAIQHFEKAYELHKIADSNAAITEFERVIELSPKSAIAQNAKYWIGQLYFETKQFDTALSKFQELIEEFPDSMVVSTTKAMIEHVQKEKDNRALFEAVTKGDIEQVKQLIAERADIEAKWSDFYNKNEGDPILLARHGLRDSTPLWQAADSNNMDLVKLFVEAGADTNAGSWPLLCQAVDRNNIDIVEYLIDHGAKVNYPEDWGPLQEASALQIDNIEMIKLLLEKGADINGGTLMPALHTAIFKGPRKDLVELLIQQGADINVKDGWGHNTPLYYSIGNMLSTTNNDNSNVDIMKLLIDNGADVKMEGNTLIHLAARTGKTEVVQLLLEKGADISAKDDRGRTALHRIFDFSNSDSDKARLSKDMVGLLLAKGLDVNLKDKNGRTPLHLAAGSADKDIIKLLLDKGANINAKNNNGGTPLHAACQRGNKEVAALLIDKGADIDKKNNEGLTPIHQASRSGQKDVVELLIDKGADIEIRSYWDCTPLYEAIAANQPEVAELLLNHGAKIDAISKFWGTIAHGAMRVNRPEMVRWSINKGVDIPQLHQAAYFGELDKVKSLISEGANVNKKDVAEFTPLHCATLGQNREIVQLLIDKGADIEARQCGNRTALYNVCERGYLEMVKLLIDNGADWKTPGSNRDEFSSNGFDDDWTSLHVAVKTGNVEIVRYLLEHGADIHTTCHLFDDEGITALHIAAWRGRLDVAKVLLADGADVNAKTNKGITPASLAEKNEYIEIVSLLLGEPLAMDDIIESAQNWEAGFTEWFNKQTPDFTIKDITGKRHKISDYRGKNLILNFWATWCGPCLKEIPDIIKLRKTVSEDELAILGISLEKGKTDLVKEFAEKEKINYTILVSEDTLVPPYSEINAIPTTFIIDPEGKIKMAAVGTLTYSDLNNLLDAK